MNFLNSKEEFLDDHVYRIMKQEYVFALFKEKSSALSSVSNWKDKFENFQLRIGGVLDAEPFSYGFKNDFVGQCWTRDAYSEAMWGIYANDPKQRYIRIRSTPRKLLKSLMDEHPTMPQETCFIGNVEYKSETELKSMLKSGGHLELSSMSFAKSLLLKRKAFRHEKEVRLIHFSDSKKIDENGLYWYNVDPHNLITQLMADPNRDRSNWKIDKAEIKKRTGFSGSVKRSKIYDAPDWSLPNYQSGK